MKRSTLLSVLLGLLLMPFAATDAMAMMNPTTGRFIQADPLGYPDGMNRYGAYHVMHGGVDPSGMESEGIGTFLKQYQKNGEKMNLGQVGLLGDFRSSASVKMAEIKLKQRVEREARNAAYNKLNCANNTSDTIKGTLSEPINLTFHTKLMPLGNGFLKIYYQCEIDIWNCRCCAGGGPAYPDKYTFECIAVVYYEDWFKDPFEHEEHPQTHEFLDRLDTLFNYADSVNGIGGRPGLRDFIPKETATPYKISAEWLIKLSESRDMFTPCL